MAPQRHHHLFVWVSGSFRSLNTLFEGSFAVISLRYMGLCHFAKGFFHGYCDVCHLRWDVLPWQHTYLGSLQRNLWQVLLRWTCTGLCFDRWLTTVCSPRFVTVRLS